MPTRPNQHKLEDLSRAKFQLALPKRWVFRDKDKDYGIDGEVELFDELDKAQGLLFYVQLKATESESENAIMSVDINIETLKYYKQLDIPVLLVRYSEFRDCFFAKWVYNVDLFYCKDNAKTHRISFENKDLWDCNTFIKIEERLTNIKKLKSGYLNFPISYSLNIDDNKIQDISKPILTAQLKKYLSEYNAVVEHKCVDNSFIVVNLNNHELKINILDLAGCFFHNINMRDKSDFAKGISKDILLGIAYGMVQIGQIDYCGKIVFENNLQARLIENKELLIYMLPPLFKSSYFKKVLDLIGKVLEGEFSFEVSILTMLNLLLHSNSNSKSQAEAIESFLKNRLVSAINSGDKMQIGIAYYNLGNHYRGKSRLSDSVTSYVLAKRNEPKYLNQDYFYSELAGTLFSLEKYKFAAGFYSKAIDIGSNNAIKGLYADALMFAGEYERAINVFLEYLNNTDSPIDEFHLKAICLRSISETKGIRKQRRNPSLATSKADLSNLEFGFTIKEQLDNSLNIDLLCGLAWFNYGVTHSEESDYSSAALSFTMAGLVQRNDVEAWKNATLCSFNYPSSPLVLGLIIRTAYTFNGDDFLENLYSHLEQTNANIDITPFAEVFDTILPKGEERNNLPIIRMLNEDGKFHNIFNQ